MTALTIFAAGALILLLLILWAAWRYQESRPRAEEGSPVLEDSLPVHCRFFPQVHQALSAADRSYLKDRASPALRRKAAAMRRQVAIQFLAGLQEDYSRLERLGRTIAALSPQVSRREEIERMWLGIRFRFLLGIVRIRLLTGNAPMPSLARLTQMIGSQATRLEAAMTALERNSGPALPSNLNA